MKATDIVKNYYAALDSHDFAKARALMHDRFRFVGPMMEASSPEDLFGKMKGFDCTFTNRMVHMVESGNTVGSLFDCTFSKPFQATIRMSEWFTVEGGKILSSNLVYDTRQMPMPAPAASLDSSMAYDEALAQRIRDILADRGDVVEQKMFGGVAFMVGGRMACGPHGDRLIVRIGAEAAAKYIGKPHVKPMDFTGRVMRAFATIEPEGLRTSAQLRRWVTMAAEFAATEGPRKQSAEYSGDGRATTTMKKATTTMKKTKCGSKEGKVGDSPPRLIDARSKVLTDWRGATLARVRMLIRQADPEAVEEVKWRKPSNSMAGVPVWSHDGIICTGETYKDKVKLTFVKGAALADPSGLFNSSLDGNARRAIDIHEGDKVDEAALKDLIRAAVALNLKGKSKPKPRRAKG